MKNVLVTGAAGFIGSHLIERLLAAKYSVIGVDNFNTYYDPVIKRGNISTAQKHPNFRLVEGDIRDAGLIDRLFAESGFDTIIHLAAMAGVRPSIQDPVLYYDVNVTGTVILAEAARRHNVPKFVFGSSSSVYGGNDRLPFQEDEPLRNLLSPYAATKAAGELLLKNHADLHGMNVSCLRFFTVYGPRQRPEMAIHLFTDAIFRGQPISMFGNGSSQRDYTYVDDIIQGVVKAAEHCKGYEIYNLGESQTISLKDLIALLETACGRKAVVQQKPDQPGDAPRTWADIAKAKEKLGYLPTTTIQRGVAKFVAWYRDKHGIR